MPPKKYTYNEQSDFLMSKANTEKLYNEIVLATGIITDIIRIDTVGPTFNRQINIWFNDELNPSEKLELDGNASSPASGIIGGHDYTTHQGARRVFIGDATMYAAVGTVATSQVQYTQIYLNEGDVIIKLATFVANSYSGAKFKLGLYEQVDSLDSNGSPASLVAATNDFELNGTEDNSYIELPLASGNYTVPKDGFYFLAHICDNGVLLKWETSLSYRANFLRCGREASTNTTLPQTANIIYDTGAIVYVSAILENI